MLPPKEVYINENITAAFGYLASGKVNGKEDVFRAAFDPLFTNADRIRLGRKLHLPHAYSPGEDFPAQMK